MYLSIIIGVVVFHLIEVNFLDQIFTNYVGYDFAISLQQVEGDLVSGFSNLRTPVLIYFFVIMYIIVYPFTLLFAPLYFLIYEKNNSLKNLAYGLLLIYLIALPFYLFMPITNVYSFYSLDSALETAIPGIEGFFYTTTTSNNCLPSLHTAMTIMIAYTIYLTGNKKLTYFAIFTMFSVITSVIYLSIHWMFDVFAGCVLAIAVILILRHFIRDKKK